MCLGSMSSLYPIGSRELIQVYVQENDVILFVLQEANSGKDVEKELEAEERAGKEVSQISKEKSHQCKY